MNRRRKLVLNTVSSLVKQFVSVICAFILPRLFLTHYGSDVNGLVASITQFISLICVFDAGMGVVIEASLYKPLADNNRQGISEVMTSGQRFYKKIVQIMFVYVVLLAIVYPYISSEEFEFIFTCTLVLAISISSFGQFALGVTSSVLLSADQKSYINFWTYTITTILNTVVGAVLIYGGASVHVVKLASSIIFLIRPVILTLYVKRNYEINWHEKYNVEPIKQKWNGFAQHIAAIVIGNTDVVVLTLFSALSNVSVYSVYFLVITSVNEIINATTAGIKSLLGEMIAKQQKERLASSFDLIEWGMHLLITLLFSLTAVLILPFILVYTNGVNDANYNVPVFAVLLSVAYMIFCLRIPYFIVIYAAGHFKETQCSAIIEATINIIVTVVAVFKFGLIGAAVGTIIAMFYRLVYLVLYLRNSILLRNCSIFVKNVIIDVLCFLVVFVTLKNITLHSYTFFEWVKYAINSSIVGTLECLLINIIFYNSNVIKLISYIKQRKVQND